MGLVKGYRLLSSAPGWARPAGLSPPVRPIRCRRWSSMVLRRAAIWHGAQRWYAAIPGATAGMTRSRNNCPGMRLFSRLSPSHPTILTKEVFMNDIRRTILWVIFGFSMVLLWDKWQLHNGNKATFFPKAPPRPHRPLPQRRAGGQSGVPVPPACLQPPRDTAACPRRWRTAAQVPGAARGSGWPPRRVSASTSPPTCCLTFDTEGGSITGPSCSSTPTWRQECATFVLLDESAATVSTWPRPA
jgi:hypothetical protein